MVSRTRERLIEVARQLFAYKGVENTTMNDIAAASEKGRRTIYTYFRNKREIYNAVIEQQSSQIVDRLRAIVENTEITPTVKLHQFLHELLNMLTQSVPQKSEGRLRFLPRDHKRIARISRLALDKEKALLNRLIEQGIESGEFNPAQALRLPMVISLTIDSFFVSHSDDSEALSIDVQADNANRIVDFLVTAVLNPANNQPII